MVRSNAGNRFSHFTVECILNRPQEIIHLLLLARQRNHNSKSIEFYRPVSTVSLANRTPEFAHVPQENERRGNITLEFIGSSNRSKSFRLKYFSRVPCHSSQYREKLFHLIRGFSVAMSADSCSRWNGTFNFISLYSEYYTKMHLLRSIYLRFMFPFRDTYSRVGCISISLLFRWNNKAWVIAARRAPANRKVPNDSPNSKFQISLIRCEWISWMEHTQVLIQLKWFTLSLTRSGTWGGYFCQNSNLFSF